VTSNKELERKFAEYLSINELFVGQFTMDEEPVIKEEPYSDGELDPLQTNSETAAESEVSYK
jgi:hypothetical protein